jgi:hypothetical protein
MYGNDDEISDDEVIIRQDGGWVMFVLGRVVFGFVLKQSAAATENGGQSHVRVPRQASAADQTQRH